MKLKLNTVLTSVSDMEIWTTGVWMKRLPVQTLHHQGKDQGSLSLFHQNNHKVDYFLTIVSYVNPLSLLRDNRK